ncbi:putative EF-hand domain-containing family member A2 [Trichinella spiralis]|uniref:putative EF-hand domain-containing family member A2 n=1 Tax=Trichinella spiralis TaxID=6334 RepID=UPI0001EFCCDC|nr:putative EF-hand domain-containing family member A2 [Trichinella spiralis]
MLSYYECVTTLARRWRSSLQVRPWQTWSRGHKISLPSHRAKFKDATSELDHQSGSETMDGATEGSCTFCYFVYCQFSDCKPFGVVRSHFINCSTIEEANLPSWKRFFEFSSFNCEGKAYMSPFDFMQSLTSKTSPEALQLTKDTPSVTSSSCTFFRDANHHGLISYFDYLFLLSLLSGKIYEKFISLFLPFQEPESRFRIAFDLFDQNKDGKLEMDEFYRMASGILPKKLRESNG